MTIQTGYNAYNVILAIVAPRLKHPKGLETDNQVQTKILNTQEETYTIKTATRGRQIFVVLKSAITLNNFSKQTAVVSTKAYRFLPNHMRKTQSSGFFFP